MPITQSTHSDKLFYMTGDLFSPDNHFDGIAAFVPAGASGFGFACKHFIQQDAPGIVMIADLNKENRIYRLSDVDNMVVQALNALCQHGVKSIGMNGIRTDLGAGPSEQAVARSCARWLQSNPNEEIKITLVDKRGGFIKYCN